MNKFPINLMSTFRGVGKSRGALFGGILMLALLAFEIFNYTTTDFALTDVLGANLKFLGLRWATILSIAFCAIDFAGIARLFTPEQGQNEPVEVWYLFGAWVLAAAMNATLTWWGVSVAINSHTAQGASIVGRDVMSNVVPVFVAVMVWLIRILIIGTFSMAGERLFSMDAARANRQPANRYEAPRPAVSNNAPRPMPRPEPAAPLRTRSEPSYHPVGMAAKSREDEKVTWR
ncbi:MAG: hypothetical protein CVU44_16175 [Chloroflexi bacterium HGW-Chloroflexi-6]|nr:MAG: hypothetical protein CVU44_16175 [Chloroflexi bacterium HGW-Chloroflexi-6]